MIFVLPIFWGVSIVLATAYSISLSVARNNRRIACLGLRDENLLSTTLPTCEKDEGPRSRLELQKQSFSSQNYYAKPNSYYSWFQRNLLDAPLFRRRKFDNYAISRKDKQTDRDSVVLVLGSIPGRLQALITLLYLSLNTCLCLLGVDWSQRDRAAKAISQRSGKASVLNLIPLLLLACRNNPVLSVCGISDYTRIMLHRWCGRLVVIEAICHSLAYLLPQIWNGMWTSFTKNTNILTSL